MNLSRAIISIVLLFSFLACKVSYQSVEKTIKIEEVYIQEEVPGVQNELPKNYLNFSYKKDSLISFDSVVFQSPIFNDETFNSLDKERTQITKRINPIISESDTENQLTIFFKKGKHFYRQTVSPILIKEPIYLP